MVSKRTKADDLSEPAVVERAKSIANEWMWAVSLQHDRIVNPRNEDQRFHPWGLGSFNEADIHFLVIALGRLRQAAATIEHVPSCWDSVRNAIKAFDDALPWRKQLRDVFEHLDDYATDSDRRRTNTERKKLQVWSTTGTGLIFLGYDVDWNKANEAAKNLYSAVKAIYESFPRIAKRQQRSPQKGGSE